MGPGRRARHGEGPRRATRLLLRAAAGGLRVRLPAGERRLAGGDELAGVVVAVALRSEHHPRAGQPDHPLPGGGVRGLGSGAGPDEAHQHQDPRRVARRCDHPAVLLPGAADDGLQLDEPRHPGRLPDLPDVDRQPRRRPVQRDGQVDRRSSTTSAPSLAACSSARCRSASAAATPSSSARCWDCRSFRCSPTHARRRCCVSVRS